MVEEYIAKVKAQYPDFQIRLITYSGNRGVSYARNQGIEAAQGQWLLFIDVDDWVDNDYLQDFAYAIYKYPKLRFFMSNCQQVNCGSKKVKQLSRSQPTDIINQDLDDLEVYKLEAINDIILRSAARIA